MPAEKPSNPESVSLFRPPAEASELSGSDAAIYRRYRALGLFCCYFLWGLSAAFAVLRFEVGSLLSVVGTAWAGTLACISDSCLSGRYWPRAFHSYTFWAWPLALPAYLIWSRKRAALWPIVAHFAALLVLVFFGASVMAALLTP